jgi:glycosyltransferase involved in cell wall biosynthesis
MNIVYNAYVLNKPITGIGRYLQALSFISTNNNKIALTPNSEICWKNNFSNINSRKFYSKIGKLIWNYFHPIFYTFKFEIYHSPYPSLPFFLPSYCKKIITVHDLIFFNSPNDYPFLEFLFINFSFKNAIKRADVIVCVSEYTKNCLTEKFPISKNKIKVVLNSSIKNTFINDKNPTNLNLLSLLKTDNKYFVLPSNRHPRKNINNTITAFYNSKYFKNNYKLVLCGLDESVQKNKNNNVIDISYLSDSDYMILLKNAHGLFYFSYDEGFGYPITEAIDNNIPIFCSNIPSSLEIFDNNEEFLCSDLSSIGIKDFLDSYYDNNSKIEQLKNLMQSKKDKFNYSSFENEMNDIYSKLI